MESQKLYTFIELPVYMRQLETLASFETLYAIQSDLLEDPERWPVIKGTGGARKGRVADPRDSRGKSGSSVISISIWNIAAESSCYYCSAKMNRLTSRRNSSNRSRQWLRK